MRMVRTCFLVVICYGHTVCCLAAIHASGVPDQVILAVRFRPGRHQNPADPARHRECRRHRVAGLVQTCHLDIGNLGGGLRRTAAGSLQAGQLQRAGAGHPFDPELRPGDMAQAGPAAEIKRQCLAVSDKDARDGNRLNFLPGEQAERNLNRLSLLRILPVQVHRHGKIRGGGCIHPVQECLDTLGGAGGIRQRERIHQKLRGVVVL